MTCSGFMYHIKVRPDYTLLREFSSVEDFKDLDYDQALELGALEFALVMMQFQIDRIDWADQGREKWIATALAKLTRGYP